MIGLLARLLINLVNALGPRRWLLRNGIVVAIFHVFQIRLIHVSLLRTRVMRSIWGSADLLFVSIGLTQRYNLSIDCDILDDVVVGDVDHLLVAIRFDFRIKPQLVHFKLLSLKSENNN